MITGLGEQALVIGIGQEVTSFPARVVISAIVAVLALAAAYFVRRLRREFAERFSPVAVDLVASAATIGIVVAAVVIVADLWDNLEPLVEDLGVVALERRAPQVAVTIVVLVAVQVFTSIARRLLDDITRGSDAMSEHEREVSYRLTQILFWTVAFIVILGVWEVNVEGLLIGAGFAGIVLGMAARETLGAMLAGLVLMFSRPFEVGDWIAVAEDEGVVTDITVMNTRIQAFSGEYVVVPNDVVGSEIVTNRSRKGRLRIEVDVGVDYTTDVERAREVATEAISEIDMIMDVPRPETVTSTFDESAIALKVRGWIEHPSSRRRWRARTRMVNAIKERFAEEGIKIPFPQRELSGRAEQGGFQVADEAPPTEAEQADGVDERAPESDAERRAGETVGSAERSTDGGADE